MFSVLLHLISIYAHYFTDDDENDDNLVYVAGELHSVTVTDLVSKMASTDQ